MVLTEEHCTDKDPCTPFSFHNFEVITTQTKEQEEKKRKKKEKEIHIVIRR